MVEHMGLAIIPLEPANGDLVVEAARVLAPFEASVADTWDELCLRHLGERPRAEGSSREVVWLFLTSLVDGDLGDYFERIDQRGAELARTREQYEKLILAFHLFEDATMPHLRRHFAGRIGLALDALDHLYHNVIAILARAYFRQLERERERFVHILAHDLKNPLAVLVASSGLLLRLADRKDVAIEQVRDLAERMRVNSQRVAALVDGVLDYARLKGGKVGPHTRFDVVDAAREAVRLFLPRGDADRLRLLLGGRPHLDSADLAPVFVEAERSLVVRAIGNYLSNAAKYARGLVAVTVEEQAEGVVVSVRDDGAGIPADQLEKIFDDYYTVPGGKPGTGLGLPSVRLVAQIHGGRAWAISAPGEGARFYLSLPRAQAGRAVTHEGQ